MPITVNCNCGKVFKVKDETAGATVVCQVCGRELVVGESLPPAAAVPVAAMAAAATIAVEPKTVSCPACAEQIPARSIKCPMCGEALTKRLEKDEFTAAIEQVRSELDAHLDDAQAMESDATLRGGLTVLTIVLMALFGIGVLMVVSGIAMGDNGAGLVGFGVFIGLIFI